MTPEKQHKPAQRAHGVFAHPVFHATVLVVLVLGLFGAFLLFSHRSTEVATTRTSGNEARVLATQLEGALRRVDMSAAFLLEHYLEAGLDQNVGSATWRAAFARFEEQVLKLARYFPEAISIFITDQDGKVRVASFDEPVTWDLGSLDYFKAARAAPVNALQFSPTLLILNDLPSVIGYRPILSRDGSFAGLIAIAINLGYFEYLLSGLDAGSRGVVTVRRSDDSRLVMRWPALPDKFNSPALDIPSYRMIKAGERSGVARYLAAADRVDRIFAFQALDEYPFFVIVGRSVDEQFALWRQTSYAAAAVALGTLLLLLAMQAGLRNSQARLARSEHQFDALLDSRHDAACIWRPDTRIVSCNARYAQLFGQTPAALAGKRWIDWMDPAHRDQSLIDIETILSRTGMTTIEHQMRHADGTLHWVRWTNLPVLDDEGQRTAIQSIGQDITTLKQNEMRLRQLGQAVEQSPNGIVITDAEARIEYANEAFTRITGYAPEEVIGQNPRILSSGQTPDSTHEALWSTLARGDIWRGEFINARKDGSTFRELDTIAPIKQSDGSISHFVAIKEDITERCEAEARIQRLAFHDALTGLANRSLLWDRLKQAILASERSAAYGVLLLVDIDHFKVINDTQGHEAGDALLREVARRLQDALRSYDTAARLGGDDFAVVIEAIDPDHKVAVAYAERIAEQLYRTLVEPFDLGLASGPYRSTPSIGITLFRGRESDVDGVLKQAEVALYRAKEDGRNAIRFFSAAMQSVVDARAQLEVKLRTAIAEDGFRLFYQAQVDRSGRIIGAEALIRSFDRAGNMISPATFIPLAEETGLIVPIGDWVLGAACAQLRAWQQDANTRDYTLSINVSAKQFHQPDFVHKVREAVKQHQITPERLKIELTESVVLGDIETTVGRMEEIKALGVKFALDDFGTGYSSLSYLKRLPFDQLKIDQMFVRDMALDNSSEAIVRAILAMSRSLELEVVAEGVETCAQHELLLTRGCEMFQGYLFGKPVPIEDWPAC